MANEKEVMQALKTVIDPELGVDIVELGFIYWVEIKKKKIKIVMTLTTPGCPLAPVIEAMVREAVGGLEGVEEKDVLLELSFDPPWTQDMMSEEAKLELGFL